MITKEQIQKLVEAVVAETSATGVYLFGSYAENNPNENSDVDLIVILNQSLTKKNRRDIVATLGLKTAVNDLFFPKDFKIYSREEFEKLKEDKYSFLSNILQTAKLLYVG
jgi:uncharacterized protein